MMASPGNPSPQGGGVPFDMQKFFKPSAAATTPLGVGPNPQATSPNPQYSNSSSSPLPPFCYPSPHSAGSYPTPTVGPYSYPPQTSLFHHPQYLHPHIAYLPQQQQDGQVPNLHNQKSMSYPSPPLQPPSPHQFQPQQNYNPNPGSRLMALLSAPPPSILEIPQQLPVPTIPMPPSVQHPSFSGGGSDFSIPLNVPVMPPGTNFNTGVIGHSSPMRMPSSKLPKGRHLVGDHLVYNIDVRLPGEVRPQLEVTPITKYGSDPGLVLGRQIAVNKTYICYGLKLGAIRVLNINTALRSLLKGLSQRVTDMVFFAEDVHILAGASTDGQVYVWKITEDPDEEDKPQITGKIIIAIQIIGDGESVHPRVCWHCHKQEILVVGVGRHVMRIDTTKVGKGEVYSAEEPLKCPVHKLIDGVQLVGTHDGEVTDLSMCQWMMTYLVSASLDGTIKIWEDRKLLPIAVLRPHDGQPVNSVTFLTAHHRPGHITLITGGPLNREVKIWTSASEEGWLLPSDAESWQCTQTLELRSSAEAQVEEVFFNQVAALPQASLFLLANAKKNTIYAIHLEYTPNPTATRMDYIAEFTVTMPILSFTGTCEVLPHSEQVIQIYCVQTQAIQQYALELSQCFPPTMENVVFERSDSSVSLDAANVDGLATLQPSGSKLPEIPLASTASKPSLLESSSESVSVRHPASSASGTITSQELSTLRMNSKAVSLPVTIDVNDISCVPSSLPLSPRLSHKHSGLGSPTNSIEPVPPLGNHGGEQKVIEYSVDRQMESVHTNLSLVPSMDDDSRNDEKKAAQNDNSMVINHHVKYKHPTHLVTPAEILMGSSTSEGNDKLEHKSEVERNIHDVVICSDMQNVEVEVKVFGDTRFKQTNESGFQGEAGGFTPENREKSFCSQTSDLGSEMTRESTETYIMGESRKIDGPNGSENMAKSCTEEEVLELAKVVAGNTVDSAAPTTAAQTSAQSAKGKKHKGKNAQGSGSSSPSPISLDPIDSSIEPDVSLGISSTEAVFPQVMAMQKMLNQLTILQKEMQKQMAVMVTVPVTKEGRRLEAALGKNMEKAIKSNVDTMWGHFQEENARQEKLARDRMQQITNLITNCVNKDLPAAVEKTVKKELATVGPAVAHTISPTVEETVSAAIAEAFQRVGDRAINQLERSISLKLEATVARKIQAQFQTSGKQALQEILKSNFEASVIPAFEVSCKAMFNQVNATFQKGMAEHTTAAKLQLESTHSQLALGLRDAINSASSVTQMLSGELADSQRKLLALAITGASPKSGNSLVSQISNGHLGGLNENIETSLDPTRELTRMISEHKYDEAFTTALQRSDVSIVSWLCSQVDLLAILSMNPLPLSQGVLISLLQQLACDTSKDTPQKLSWMRDVIVAINPTDPMISVHVCPIFDQVYQILNHHRGLPTTSNAEISSIRVIMHIINSILMTCK